jgi:hypothetical protein
MLHGPDSINRVFTNASVTARNSHVAAASRESRVTGLLLISSLTRVDVSRPLGTSFTATLSLSQSPRIMSFGLANALAVSADRLRILRT